MFKHQLTFFGPATFTVFDIPAATLRLSSPLLATTACAIRVRSLMHLLFTDDESLVPITNMFVVLSVFPALEVFGANNRKQHFSFKVSSQVAKCDPRSQCMILSFCQRFARIYFAAQVANLSVKGVFQLVLRAHLFCFLSPLPVDR